MAGNLTAGYGIATYYLFRAEMQHKMRRFFQSYERMMHIFRNRFLGISFAKIFIDAPNVKVYKSIKYGLMNKLSRKKIQIFLKDFKTKGHV